MWPGIVKTHSRCLITKDHCVKSFDQPCKEMIGMSTLTAWEDHVNLQNSQNMGRFTRWEMENMHYTMVEFKPASSTVA